MVWLSTSKSSEYPQFGNNDARVDDMAVDTVERFMKKIQKLTLPWRYPDAVCSTITSNVVYGRKPVTPRMVVALARRSGRGANPMRGRDRKSAVASLTSVAKLPFCLREGYFLYSCSVVPERTG